MMRRATFLLALLALSAASTLALAADPTVDQVFEAARAGRLAEAQQMMSEVLRDHPRSAKAHYVAAEIYARSGQIAQARQELATARSIEPGLPFARPQSVNELERELNGGGGASRYAPAAARSSFNWGWILLGVAVLAIIWSLMRRRTYFGGAGGMPAPGYGPGPMPPSGGYSGYGVPGYGPMGGGGGGLMGSLGTGLAVGAGVAAGESLMGRLLDEHGRPIEGDVAPGAAGEAPFQANPDMGGQDFGIQDGGGWDDGGGGGGDVGGGDWT